MANRKSHAKRLSDLDMDAKIPKDEYEPRLEAVQTRFRQIQQAYLHTKDEAVIVFEGWDAAGKGGAIRRMASVMDPRGFRVWPIGAPSAEELARHYLARFWERLPAKGEIAVFDRSWYGRVLVERVEGFAEEAEWRRAYEEINQFEAMLTDAGTRIAKVFLYIDRDEQLERFEKRLRDPLKRWKLSFEDFRNRDKWDQYEEAVNDMLERTDTTAAPWQVISANHKKYARVTALTGIADRLANGVDLSPRPLDSELERRFERETTD
ncbi:MULTISPECIES: polyphosphate kinase 2 family protein [unclassified Aurantimonas]|uniref:polyphosphate kinase 2 family protein n=1 Tax=unclassified Aurantimonas TaxID=2638230 RepID=UPI002E190972|nr:polyphosphate kinase [Aurantimonas sp. A3-2-R12]